MLAKRSQQRHLLQPLRPLPPTALLHAGCVCLLQQSDPAHPVGSIPGCTAPASPKAPVPCQGSRGRRLEEQTAAEKRDCRITTTLHNHRHIHLQFKSCLLLSSPLPWLSPVAACFCLLRQLSDSRVLTPMANQYFVHLYSFPDYHACWQAVSFCTVLEAVKCS